MTKAINLAAMLAPLPPVRFPTGAECQVRPFTAEAYELFRLLRDKMQGLVNGTDEADDAELQALADRLLRLVVPEATPDDVASLGDRFDAKLVPIMVASGRVEDVLSALTDTGAVTEGKGRRSPRSNGDTSSARKSRATPKRLVSRGRKRTGK
jgi:hypothetical protein